MGERVDRDNLGEGAARASGRRRLWTIDDLANFLGVPVATVYKWRHAGEGPPGYRIGRYLRFDEKEVMDWLETRRSTPGED
ncbi:helix-turn-helix domain-containing protein [Frankia sp. EAN1pec]|uniref:helix-turn-helix domain-containing protein n=1 Tax=Parafrankia sp. (strain EAN1pec) TaxID=298653 RepID=UPI0000542F31